MADFWGALVQRLRRPPTRNGPTPLVGTLPVAQHCVANECWDIPASVALDHADYQRLEAAVAKAVKPAPSFGWGSYCDDHLRLFLLTGRWNVDGPLWSKDLVACRIKDCPGVAGSTAAPKHGTIVGPAGERLDGLCFLHQSRFAIYGTASRPKILAGRDLCTYEGPRPSPTGADTKKDPIKCREPAVANELCLFHVLKHGSLQDARRVVNSWEGEDRLHTIIEQPTDDTWRVLAEIQAILAGLGSRAHLPYIFDGIEFGLSMVFGLPNINHRLHWALKYSPHELGAALDMEPELVAAHIRFLIDSRCLVEDPKAALPRNFAIVVREFEVSGRLQRYWRWTKFKHWMWDFLDYHPRYMIQSLPKNLPRKGESRFIAVLDGPGVLSTEHQGRCWKLTEIGWVRLRQWRQQESERRRREIAETGDRRLARIGLFVAVMAIVSVIADANSALSNLQTLINWLFHR